MQTSYLGINLFGSKGNQKLFSERVDFLKKEINNFIFYLVIAGTETSQSKVYPQQELIQKPEGELP